MRRDASLSLTLAPAPGGLTVRTAMSGMDFVAGRRFLGLSPDVTGVSTIDPRQCDLVVRDRAGVVPHTLSTTAVVLDRDTVGRVDVSYFARARRVNGRPQDGLHPPTGLLEWADGISGQGRTFLLLPEIDDSLDFRLSWEAPAGMQCVTSAGSGDVSFTTSSGERLRDLFVMTGVIRTECHSGISVHCVEDLPFRSPRNFVNYCAASRSALAKWFDEPLSPCRIFLRCYPSRGLSGSGVHGGMVIGCNRDELQTQNLRYFLDHEFVHAWAFLDGTYEETVWYTEGIAEYLAAVIPLSDGRSDATEFLRRINRCARLAYGSPLRDEPLTALAPNYWNDPLAQREPYLRGFFYFVRLDHALRVRESSVLALTREVRRRQGHGERVGTEEWHVLVESVLGDTGTRLHRDVVAGGADLPHPGVWGPGFHGDVRKTLVPDPGFGRTSFFTKVVDSVRPGSPADLAGLEPGDRLPDLPDYYEVADGRHGTSLRLKAERDGRVFEVSLDLGTRVVRTPLWRGVEPAE